MAQKLLQINFPFAGPWGEGMTDACTDLAHLRAETPGLLWKVWLENAETGEAGGIYLFEDERLLRAFLEEHTARLCSFGIEGIEAKTFEVNGPLTLITRGEFGVERELAPA